MSSSKLMICPDGHRCENGSICIENPQDEGSFYCDCDEASISDVYVGLYCEHKATAYCTIGQEVSSISFCTNDGTCTAQVSASSAHLGCECKTGYVGDHCEFIQGSVPKGGDWPYGGGADALNNAALKSDAGLQDFVVAVIVIVVLATVAGVAFLIYRKKKQMSAPHTTKEVLDASDLQLDADGAVLVESMQDNSSPAVVKEGGSIITMNDAFEATEDMQDIRLGGSHENEASEII